MEIVQVVVALFLICMEISQTTADVIATSPHNFTTRFQSVTAAFGLPPNGQMGLLVVANPLDACQLIDKPPISPNTTEMYFALIKRGHCEFDLKVFNAQQAGYLGAIVYNDEGNILTTMSGSRFAKAVYIPSVFVGLDSGVALKGMNYTTGRDMAIRKQLRKVEKDPSEPVFSSAVDADTDLYRLSIQLLKNKQETETKTPQIPLTA